jgi:hypothetical protein
MKTVKKWFYVYQHGKHIASEFCKTADDARKATAKRERIKYNIRDFRELLALTNEQARQRGFGIDNSILQ